MPAVTPQTNQAQQSNQTSNQQKCRCYSLPMCPVSGAPHLDAISLKKEKESGIQKYRKFHSGPSEATPVPADGAKQCQYDNHSLNDDVGPGSAPFDRTNERSIGSALWGLSSCRPMDRAVSQETTEMSCPPGPIISVMTSNASTTRIPYENRPAGLVKKFISLPRSDNITLRICQRTQLQ